MRAPLLHKVMKALVSQGVAVLRFNFRGVGTSTGTWSGGSGEMDDVAAAMAEGRTKYDEVAIAGWSFGAATSLRWQQRDGDTATYVGIAPPVSNELVPALPAELPVARRLFILGDRDQFVTADELNAYAESIDAAVEVLPGSDHFFYFREQQVGELVADFVTG